MRRVVDFGAEAAVCVLVVGGQVLGAAQDAPVDATDHVLPFCEYVDGLIGKHLARKEGKYLRGSVVGGMR